MKSTVTITVMTNYGGGEYGYCGAGPFLSAEYKKPGQSYYTYFDRPVCSGQVDSTSMTVEAGGVLRIYASPYVGISGCGVSYPCSGFGSCTREGGSSVKDQHYYCEFTVNSDTTYVFGYCCEQNYL